MINFTSEYIELCKFSKVQGLRPKLDIGDWYIDMDYYMKEKEIQLYDYDFEVNRKPLIWLPIGDNLDTEIMKICNKNVLSHVYWTNYNPVHHHYFAAISVDYDGRPAYFGEDKNPLIAKLNLLIRLLEGEENE